LKYLLDSNTYIQAKNFYYDMTFCPAYWHWLDLKYSEGHIASIRSVYDELSQYGDELTDWVKERKDQFISIADNAMQQKYTEIVQYVYDLENKNPNKVDKFLSKADPWLIAKACTTGAKLVTHEKIVPANSKDIKIPNVCEKFGVSYRSTFQLLQELKAQFVLQVD
jgi:peptide subunit release factor RF-3